MKRIIIAILLSSILSACNQNNETEITSESFPYDKFIAFNDTLYVPSAEDVGEIEKYIGSIEHFSNTESKTTKTFSNYYPEGTKLYKIRDIEIEDAIAVELAEEMYVKAINNKFIHKNTQ